MHIRHLTVLNIIPPDSHLRKQLRSLFLFILNVDFSIGILQIFGRIQFKAETGT